MLGHILVCHSVDPELLFASIPTTDDALWAVFFHGSDRKLLAKVELLMASRHGRVFPYMVNRGLAKSWNEGIDFAQAQGCRDVLLLNDDLFFYDGAYKDFLHTIQAVNSLSDNVSFITVNGLESGGSPLAGKVISQGFACCALTESALRRVGCFDENFHPAYFEDVDFARRAALMRMTVHNDPRTLVEHQRSLTTRTNPTLEKEHQKIFRENRSYFEKKWGGYDGGECYVRPFNDAEITGHIAYDSRSAPYGPGRDRI